MLFKIQMSNWYHVWVTDIYRWALRARRGCCWAPRTGTWLRWRTRRPGTPPPMPLQRWLPLERYALKNSIKLKKPIQQQLNILFKKKNGSCIHPSSASLREISIKHWIQTTRFSRDVQTQLYLYLGHKKMKLNIFEWKSDYLLLKTVNSRQENLIADPIREISVNIYVLFCFCFPVRLCGHLFVERSWVLTFRRVVTRKRNV